MGFMLYYWGPDPPLSQVLRLSHMALKTQVGLYAHDNTGYLLWASLDSGKLRLGHWEVSQGTGSFGYPIFLSGADSIQVHQVLDIAANGNFLFRGGKSKAWVVDGIDWDIHIAGVVCGGPNLEGASEGSKSKSNLRGRWLLRRII